MFRVPDVTTVMMLDSRIIYLLMPRTAKTNQRKEVFQLRHLWSHGERLQEAQEGWNERRGEGM